MNILCHCAKTVCTVLLLFTLSLAQEGCSHTQRPSLEEDCLALTILHTNDTHSHIAGINASLVPYARPSRKTTTSLPWMRVINFRGPFSTA